VVSRTVTYTGGNEKSNFKVKCVNRNENKDSIHSSETATRGGLSDELSFPRKAHLFLLCLVPALTPKKEMWAFGLVQCAQPLPATTQRTGTRTKPLVEPVYLLEFFP